ncbi:MAG: gliding motility protein GldM [Saprospiraceae bacterium]
MSIPKEPRQLMINLMYLVLTALLALNVSAEIINAFFALNTGIRKSSEVVDKTNTILKVGIDKQADAYKNAQTAAARDGAEKAIEISKDFCAYITDVNAAMVTAAGGPDPKYADQRPHRYKDKDVTTRMFINEGRGKEVQSKIEETKAKFLALIEEADKASVERSITLFLDEIPADSKAKNWVDYKFKQMPVAAVMPLFSKLQADSKNTETAILNYFADKVNVKDIKFDNFKVAIAPKNGYVIAGEKFEADVYLAAYSTNPGSGVSISVNGSGLAVKEGVGHYEATSSEIGKKVLKASASIKNPLTNETKTVTSDFTYEVGRRSVAVSADKMNVFYIGVQNPISVAAAGVSSNEIRVSASGSGANLNGSGKNFVVTVGTPGECNINVSGGGLNETFKFRVKRIPDPVAQLGIGKIAKGGSMPNGEFKAQQGLVAMLEGFDFDARCDIQSYNVTYVAKRQDPVTYPNQGARYNGNNAGIINRAKPGDVYYFDEVKARCPGDQAGRQINSLVFQIK